MEAIDSALVERARKVLAQVQDAWLSRPLVTGVDVGFRQRCGELTDEIALRIYVTKKRAAADLIPGEPFPTEVEGIRVDVIEFDPERTEGESTA